MPLKPNEIEPYWTKEANKHLKGKKIVGVRYLTENEKKEMYWCSRCIVIVLDDGTLIFPSADDEGNDAGTIFGQDKNGKDFALPVI